MVSVVQPLETRDVGIRFPQVIYADADSELNFKVLLEQLKFWGELSIPTLRHVKKVKKSQKNSPSVFPISPPHRKEPVGGENEANDIKEQKKNIEDNTYATTSLPECLGQKDHDALLAMRDQARLVSTAIQLLTSPESNCLSSSPSIYHKVCTEAAECDLEKPQPHSQVHVLCLQHCPSQA